MPDRATIVAATPRCPEPTMRANEWVPCDRSLTWDHAYGIWQCSAHGRVLSMEIAGQRQAAHT